MRFFLNLLLILLIAEISQAQLNPNAYWLRHSCGYTNGINLLGGNVWGESVCVDQMGNSYNSGSFSGYWFVMDTVIEMNENRFYINKYNSSGQRIWTAKAKGTTINSIMTSSRMKCDSLGNVYVCGTFGVDDSVYMAPNWYPIGSGYVAKYDSSGNNVWCKYIPRTGTTSITFNDMAIDNDHLYVCGIMGFGTQTFGSFTFNNTHSQNGIVAKLDLNGNILFARQIDNNSTNEIHGIEVSKTTDNIYIVGQHISSNLTVDGLSLNHTNNAQNSFIIKMNDSLTAVWAKKCDTYLHVNQVVGSSVSCLKRIEADRFDNIYVAANGNGDSTILGSLKFNHRIHPSIAYAQDIYLAKLNSQGQEIWLRNGGSDGMDEVTDMATDEWGNTVLSVYSSQQSLSGLIFGNDTIAQWHGGIVKYDPLGNLLYAQKLQEARSLRALAMGKDSLFYGTGSGFNPGLPYINLSITHCEDTINGYYNPPFKMVMVKFFDNTGIFNSTYSGQSNSNLISLYPNPAIEHIQVNIPESDLTDYVICDIFGHVLLNGNISKNTSIDVSTLRNGTYILKLYDSNRQSKGVAKFAKIE